MLLKVFVENEAHCNIKNLYNEKTLKYKDSEEVSRPYPFPYGFLLNTTSLDGDNLDCYILTDQVVNAGEIVECQPIGLLEQIEDGKVDNNILAALSGEKSEVTDSIKRTLTDFILHVFDHIENKSIQIGKFFGKEEALSHIKKCLDS